MKTYLINLWDWVRTSLWFVPAILGLAAVALSFLLPLVDRTFATEALPGIGTTPTAARATLSAIAGALMTVTGTVFSITIVTLSLTSQQFGPRLLRTFLDDFPTQFTMGTLLSTGLYCLLILRVVEVHVDSLVVPHVSVAVAVLLAVFSMATLIYFIHHVAMMIQAPHVIQQVADDLDAAIERVFPEHLGDPISPAEQEAQSAEQQAGQLDDRFGTVLSRRPGYIQAVDAEGLIAFAREHDLIIRLVKRPGHFASRETLLAKVWGQPESSLDDVTEHLSEFFILGMRRTPRQDVECAIDELVEVAVRALSPGINDPFTAMNCIDWLKSSMERMARRKIPVAYRCDSTGQLRLIASPVTFPDALDAAFAQIRQYGRGSVAVLIRLLEAFTAMAGCVTREEDRAAVLNHADMVLRTAEHAVSEEEDLRVVRQRHAEVREALQSVKDHGAA